MNKYVIGVDFGTDSCRSLIVNARTGEEVATSVKYYPRWSNGKYCNPSLNQYRQHPLDYIETLEWAIKEAVSKSPSEIKDKIVGIGFDTTGSTPALTDSSGTPLALLEDFSENPNAMFILWKDHTAVAEAAEINKLAKEWHTDYTAYEGGVYSSEWVWAKVLHVLRKDEKVRNAAYSWIEHCDWIPALLTGNTRPEKIYRSRCAAGHKAMWHSSWSGLPSEEFLSTLDPLLKGFRNRLFNETFTSITEAGTLSPEWAIRLGLSTDVVVSVGAFDCHMGAVGAQISSHTLVKTIGTSTCDIMVASYEEIGGKLIPGICGQVDGSVIPGMIGLEAGQSAYGDIFAWFRQILEWPLKNILAGLNSSDKEISEQIIENTIDRILPALSEAAEKILLSKDSIVATDWLNGRRTPDANQLLKTTISGLTLGSTAPAIFKALVEAAAFGSKAIADRFLENGIKINEVVGIGGISYKSPFVMQTLANVMGMPIKIANTEQCCALGAAMFAAVAANIHEDIFIAQKKMGRGFGKTYFPNMKIHQEYLNQYKKYKSIAKFSEQVEL